MATNVIKARRKLSDLYRKGVEVRFGTDETGAPVGKIAPGGTGEFKDSDGNPLPLGENEVAMWLQAPSPLQREMAFRDAQAARSRALLRAKREKDSEDHLTVMAFLVDMNDETLIEYVLLAGAEARRQDAMRDVLADEEWKDITTLQDAMRQFEESNASPDDPEYAALLELDTKLDDQIKKRETDLMEAERDVLEMLGRDKVEAKALEKRSEVVGSQAFMAEYERQMMFYSVRDIENQSACFFESARECADQDEAVTQVFQEALAPFISDGGEAKNSLGAESGLESSEPPKKPETSESSTPEEVTV